MSDTATINFAMRPMEARDLETMAGWFANFEDIALFDRGLPVPVGLEFIKESWKSAVEHVEPPRALWYVAENAAHEAGGICGIHSINYIHGDGVVPMFVADAMRGKGLALGMAALLLELAFNHLRLHRLTTYYRIDNGATANIVEKAGFKEEGRTREGWFCDGEHKDIVQVGLLRSEWKKTRNALNKKLAAAGGVSVKLRTDRDGKS